MKDTFTLEWISPVIAELQPLQSAGPYLLVHAEFQHSYGTGAVSLTFHKLSKIILWKYTMPEMTFMVRIPSWNFVRVPEAWPWAHIQSFISKFSQEVWFLQYTNFKGIFWRARETIVKLPQDPICQLMGHPIKDLSVYASIQWEMALQCNAISHWLDTYTEWSLSHHLQSKIIPITLIWSEGAWVLSQYKNVLPVEGSPC